MVFWILGITDWVLQKQTWKKSLGYQGSPPMKGKGRKKIKERKKLIHNTGPPPPKSLGHSGREFQNEYCPLLSHVRQKWPGLHPSSPLSLSYQIPLERGWPQLGWLSAAGAAPEGADSWLADGWPQLGSKPWREAWAVHLHDYHIVLGSLVCFVF